MARADQYGKDRDSRVASELSLAGRVSLGGSNWEADALRILKNEATSSMIRVGFARSILEHEVNISEPIIVASSKLLEQALSEDCGVDGFAVAILLNAFNRLSVTPEWKSQARQLIASWNHKCRNDNDHLAWKRGIGFHPGADVLNAILGTATRLGDEAFVDQLFQDPSKSRYFNRIDSLANLVRSRQFERAEIVLIKGIERWQEETIGVETYDLALHQALKEFTARIDAADLKFFANWYLNSLSSDPENTEIPSREERFKSIVTTSFPVGEFSSKDYEQLGWLMVCTHGNLAKWIESDLDAYASKLTVHPFEMICVYLINTKGISNIMAIKSRYAILQLSKGESETFYNLLDMFNSSRKFDLTLSEIEYKSRNTCWAKSECLSHLNPWVITMLKEPQKESSVFLCELYDNYFRREHSVGGRRFDPVYEPATPQYCEAAYDGLLIQCLLHHRLDKSFQEFWQKSDAQDMQDLLIWGHNQLYFSRWLGDLKSPATHEDILNILSNPLIQESFQTVDHSLIDELLKHSIVTVDDFEKISESWTANGKLDLDLTLYYAAKGDRENAKRYAQKTRGKCAQDQDSDQSRKTIKRLSEIPLLKEK